MGIDHCFKGTTFATGGMDGVQVWDEVRWVVHVLGMVRAMWVGFHGCFLFVNNSFLLAERNPFRATNGVQTLSLV